MPHEVGPDSSSVSSAFPSGPHGSRKARDWVAKIMLVLSNPVAKELVYGGHMLALGTASIAASSAILLGRSPTFLLLLMAYLFSYGAYMLNRGSEVTQDSISNPGRTNYLSGSQQISFDHIRGKFRNRICDSILHQSDFLLCPNCASGSCSGLQHRLEEIDGVDWCETSEGQTSCQESRNFVWLVVDSRSRWSVLQESSASLVEFRSVHIFQTDVKYDLF